MFTVSTQYSPGATFVPYNPENSLDKGYQMATTLAAGATYHLPFLSSSSGTAIILHPGLLAQVVVHLDALELDVSEQPAGAFLTLPPGDMLANTVDKTQASKGSFACSFVCPRPWVRG
jgi:hypothetical protein